MEFASKRYRIAALAAGTCVALLAVGGTYVWIERTPIAASYIDEALRQRGVPASYNIARIGFRTQRIEHIRIGDPNRPDLTADWAEIGLSLGLGGVTVRSIDAGGVRLHGTLIGGRLSLGAIDRLLPKGESAKAPALPDVALGTKDARLTLEMPQGIVQARLDGQGRLSGGYHGRMQVASQNLTFGGCRLAALRAVLELSAEENRLGVDGPMEAATMMCGGNSTVSRLLLDLEARNGTDLLHWAGNIVLQRGALASGMASVTNIGGRIGFEAAPERISGSGSVIADGIRSARLRAARLAFEGEYRFDPKSRAGSVIGDLDLRGGMVDPAQADRWAGLLAGFGSTPIGPVAAAWGNALRKAGRAIDAQSTVSIIAGPAGGAARIERLDANAASGARLLLRGDRTGAVTLRWPRLAATVNGNAELGGGGLPEAHMILKQAGPGAPITGSATVAPYQLAGARLALDPVRFGPAAGGGTLISTHVAMSGPLADGRIDGLTLPVSAYLGRGGAIEVNRACAPLSFDSLAIAGTLLGRTQIPLCPSGGALFGRTAAGDIYGGAHVATPRLRGRVGDQPLTMAARSIDVTMGKPGFAVDVLAIRLGDPASPTRLDVDRLEGGVDSQGIGGRFAGAAGKIGAVPLLVSKGQGTWQLASSVLTLHGDVQVADAEQAAPRFLPLVSDDIVLVLKNGRIGVKGALKEPKSRKVVTDIAIDHDLSSGRGSASLDVRELRFVKKGLQPERITPLTLGMIADVEGAISGQGHIRWAGGTVTSDGLFHTDGLNLAAAFGPVTGLKGSIRFTDLLGLVSAPDQQVALAEVNPGISVTNGIIHYQLLPDRKLIVLGGKWPFSGGTLTLDPTTLDMGQPVARRLTFRLEAFDAGAFMQQLDFKNIAVTGKFDGILPIIFDAQGGRIENGHLTVRKEGGTLAYVGDVTNANLGKMGRLAFDALKFMRYQQLIIELNGSLDGEIVSTVRFDGTKDATRATSKPKGIAGRILAPLTNLPFRFNITIRAPFRGLVNSAQTFADPSILLRQTAPPVPADQPALIQPQ